mgnify:CR=1 FL=1
MENKQAPSTPTPTLGSTSTPTPTRRGTTTPIPILRNKIHDDSINGKKYTYAQAVIDGRAKITKNSKGVTTPSLRKKRVWFKLTSSSKRK